MLPVTLVLMTPKSTIALERLFAKLARVPVGEVHIPIVSSVVRVVAILPIAVIAAD